MATSSPAASGLAVTVLTGFLGSGKTTLLSGLLRHPNMEETAVLINEFGEVGLDHLLVRKVDEQVVLLNSGCVCCSVRGDLVDSLRDLYFKRVRSEVPEFQRVLIETTGLADPAPVLHTLMSDPLLVARYRLDGIVTTVDAVLGMGQLEHHAEAVKQVAVADRLVLTKTDLVTAEEVERLEARLRALNPAAPPVRCILGDIAPSQVLDAGLFDAQGKIPDVAGWLRAEAPRHHDHDHDEGRHHSGISSFCVTIEKPISWTGFSFWLQMLLATHGEGVLRVKGILSVAGEDRPLVVHGVQHLFHPPVALPGWPDTDRRSRLVFITRDVGREAIEIPLRAFLAAA